MSVDYATRLKPAESPEMESRQSLVLVREMEAIERGISIQEKEAKRPAAIPERTPRPYAYD